MLALEVGRTVPVDRLAEGLWGDEPPASAPQMIQLYVSHLARFVDGSGAGIVPHGRGYELELTGCDVDVRRFEHLLEDCRAREALDLWRGDPLGDVADAPFAASEIRRLDELRLRATECAIDADLAAGRHAEVLGELEALVAEQPLREHLRAQHMLALYRSGRQSDALAAYRDPRSDLVEEVGVEPGAELRGLQDAILAQDPALDLPAPAELERPAPPRPPPRAPPRRLLLAAAVLLLLGVTTFGVIRVLQPEGLPRIDENAVGLIDADSGHITAQYPVGETPAAVTAGGGSVWIANGADGSVSRVDRDRNPTTIPGQGAPPPGVFGRGAVWVAGAGPRYVSPTYPG